MKTKVNPQDIMYKYWKLHGFHNCSVLDLSFELRMNGVGRRDLSMELARNFMEELILDHKKKQFQKEVKRNSLVYA